MAMDTTNAPQIIDHVTKSIDYTPHDTKWIPTSARLIACGVSVKGTGVLNVYELSKGSMNATLELPAAAPKGIKCATFGASRIEDRHLAIGDYGGTLRVCDLERGAAALFEREGAHDGIVNAIDGVGGRQPAGSYGAPELVTGGRDGRVRVWDPRVAYAVASLEPEPGQPARDCWTVAFGNTFNQEERCVCAGYDNGDLKLFDLRTNRLRWEGRCDNAVTSVDFDRPDIEMNKMVVTTLESKFRTYDLRTQHGTDGFSYVDEIAHRSTVWISKHLPQNRDIWMTGGGNGGFNIYKYHYPSKRVGKHKQDGLPVGVSGSVELLNSRVISTQPITSFDWHPDREGLCCLSSLDQSIRVSIVTKLDRQ